jgi:hypothetical protein
MAGRTAGAFSPLATTDASAIAAASAIPAGVATSDQISRDVMPPDGAIRLPGGRGG